MVTLPCTAVLWMFEKNKYYHKDFDLFVQEGVSQWGQIKSFIQTPLIAFEALVPNLFLYLTLVGLSDKDLSVIFRESTMYFEDDRQDFESKTG